MITDEAIVFKPKTMDSLLDGMETKFLNVVKRIDSDLKSLWKSNEVLNKKFNEISDNVADLKVHLLNLTDTKNGDTKIRSNKTTSDILSDLDWILEKIVGFAKENKIWAVVVFSLFCIYNIVSLLSHLSICFYFSCKKSKLVEKQEPGKDVTEDEMKLKSVPESVEKCKIPSPPLPPPLPKPVEERKIPSPPPLPKPDYPGINEISFEGPLSNAKVELKPKLPMRTFSVPPNFRIRPHVYLPTKEDYKQILKVVETPKTPIVPTRSSSLPPKSPKLSIGSQSAPLKRRGLKRSTLPDKEEFAKKLKFVESPTPPRKVLKETAV